jgi:hypothetical protein
MKLIDNLWRHYFFIMQYIIAGVLLLSSCSVFALQVPASGRTVSGSVDGNATAAFSGKSRVSVADLLDAVALQANEVAKSPAVRRDYLQLIAKHGLRDSDILYSDYVRVRIAFEATRAGGLWGIAWNITDKEPQSDLIWTQWQGLATQSFNDTKTPTTAIAECDELSALFAFMARRIGLSKRSQVGLFWPTSNHTVAVWMVSEPKATRVVIPTSQIFLDEAQSLDTRSFDPWKQKNIYDYRRQDISLTSTMPASLANYFVMQIKRYGGLSQTELQTIRNQRELRQRKG